MIRLSDFSIERLPDYSDDELEALRVQFQERGIFAALVAKSHESFAGAMDLMHATTGQELPIAESLLARDVANEIRDHAWKMSTACSVEKSIRTEAWTASNRRSS